MDVGTEDLQEGGALTMTGTLQYSAPEVLDGFSPSHGPHGEDLDVLGWSSSGIEGRNIYCLLGVLDGGGKVLIFWMC